MTTDRDDWLVDVNVLVALTLSTHVHHRPAHAALAAHEGTWATCPLTEAALMRLLLNPAVAGRGFTAAEITGVLAGIRQDPRWRWRPDDTTLADPRIDTSILVGHQQVTDLHLTNLAAAHDCVLVTFDAGLPATLAPDDRVHVRVLPQ